MSASTYPGSYDNWSERITAALKEYNFSDPSLVYFYENLFEMLIHWVRGGGGGGPTGDCIHVVPVIHVHVVLK